MGSKIITLGTFQTKAGQDWTNSLLSTFQMLIIKVLMTFLTMINNVIMTSKIIILGTSQTMINKAGQDWAG